MPETKKNPFRHAAPSILTLDTNTFALHALTLEEIEEFLTCHPKYLYNPLIFPCGAKIRDK